MSNYLTPDSNIENTLTPKLLQNATYKTRFNRLLCMFFIANYIVGGGFIFSQIFFYIKIKEKFLIFVLIFLIVYTLGITCFVNLLPFYVSFNINSFLGIIQIKTIKLCCCFNKTKTIQINDIQKILIQKNNKVIFKNKNRQVDTIEVIFKLQNEREIKGCSGIININNENNKIYNFLRNSLPQNILIEGNLVNL